MVFPYREFSSEALFPKLLPNFFWDEIVTRYPNIPAVKLKLFQDYSVVEPFVDQINEHGRALCFFLEDLLQKVPEGGREQLEQMIKKELSKHMTKYVDMLAVKCQNNLRNYFQIQYAPKSESKAVVLTKENFSAFIGSKKLVIVDFWADWCGPCKAIVPTINELIGLYDKKISIGRVNLDHYPEIAQKYNVISIPTLLFFQGGEAQKRIVGVQSLEDIRLVIDYLLLSNRS